MRLDIGMGGVSIPCVKTSLLCLLIIAVVNARCGIREGWDGFPQHLQRADGITVVGGFLDVSADGSERIYFRYSPRSDSGVLIERVKVGKVLWRTYLKPAGATRPESTQVVRALFAKRKGLIHVHSEGSAKHVRQTHDFATGQMLKRTERETE